MKQIRKYMLAALSLAVAVSANAGDTFPANGKFTGGIIDTDQTVNLASTQSEPLVITGTVTVKAGATLTIRPNNDKRFIQFGSNGRFVIEQGATLIIGSTDAITKISDIEARIITLDAGAQFTKDNSKKESVSVGTGTDYRINNKDYLTTSQSPRSNALIENKGTLKLKGVHIHDYYGSVEQANAILHSGTAGTTTTTLYHCKISECKATVGSAILACRNKSNGSLFIEDTEIDNIISTEENEGNHGAAVRSWGNSLVHMTLTNVRIHHCFAVADAAAIYWPACSENSDGQLATLTLDGCEIDCNYSSKKVGAVDVCGSFKLGETKVTRIHHNYSGGDAGGISFRPYNSGAATSQTGLEITYNLTDKLEIYDNIANGDGGGLAVIASNTSLPGKPNFTLEVNGTKIYNNVTRTGKGGGMYLYKLAGATDAGGNAYKYYLTLIKGEIHNNKSGLKADGTYNAADGGGIYLDGLTINSEVENTVKIHNNVAGKDGGGFYITNATYTMESGELYSNTANSGNGGGLYISGTGGNLTMNEGKIYGNSTKVGNGGGIYVYNGVLSFGTSSTETELYGNTSAKSGGAIYVRNTNGDIVLDNVNLGKTANSNTATDGNGGAIYVEAMASGKKMSITNCDIINNKAIDGVSSSEDGKGGAFYVKSGNVEITGGTITGNESQLDGGSFFSEGGNLTISGASITENKSTGRNGGAFYLASGNITLTDNAVVSGNEAKLAGGAIYIENGNASLLGNSALSDNDADTDGGAIYLAKGNVTLDGNAVLSGNEAKNNGGAIYMAMATGTFTVTNGLLSTNKAQYGAGAYINGGTVNYNSGTIDGNTASANGGGLYVTGGTVTFNDGSITGNTAKNGAGLYLASGAKMTFKGGTIYSNNAVASTDKTLSETAYAGGDGNPVEGCGGGVYLQSGTSATKKTTLTFDLQDKSVQKYRSFGLYSNTAASAGADIVSEGYFTSVLLPDVSQMNLVGFEGQEANPNWYEDFFKKDPNYVKDVASYMYTGGEYDIDRMNVLRDESDLRYKNHLIKSTGFDAIKEKYLCLTLSYEYINLTITATGIIGRESILIDLIRHTMSGNNVRYSIVLPGDGTTGVASRTVFNVPWGTYSIIPRNDWNWAYEPLNAMNNVRVGDKMEHEFIFNMNHKDNSEVPLHDEKNSAKRAGAGSEEEPALIQ